MNKLIKFLHGFNDKKITIEDLSKKLDVSIDDLAEMIKQSRKADAKELSWVYIENEYFLNGVKTEDTFAQLKDGVVEKPVSIKNRYYMDSATQGNILLTQLVKGESVFKGAVDDSDIGGLYSSCFTIHGEYGKRIIDYSSLLLSDLLSIFNEKFLIEYEKGHFKVAIPNRKIECSAATFFDAFIEVVKNLTNQEDFFVVQVREVYNEDELDEEDGEEEELPHPFNYSQVFYSEKEAQEWIDNKDKENEHLVYSIVATTKLFT